MEDIKIGRMSQAKSTVTSVGTSATKIMARDARRTSVIVGSSAAGDVWVGPDNTVAASSGMLISNGAGPIYLDVQKHGQWVTGELWAITSTSAKNIAVWEGILTEDPPPKGG